MHRFRAMMIAVCVAFATLAFTAVASADVKAQHHKDGISFYDFEDDDMLGNGLNGMDAVLKVRKRAARTQLMRPRGHFVPEMLKSIEQI